MCAKDKYFVYRKKIEGRKEGGEKKRIRLPLYDLHGWKGWKRKYTSEALIIHA